MVDKNKTKFRGRKNEWEGVSIHRPLDHFKLKELTERKFKERMDDVNRKRDEETRVKRFLMHT